LAVNFLSLNACGKLVLELDLIREWTSRNRFITSLSWGVDGVICFISPFPTCTQLPI